MVADGIAGFAGPLAGVLAGLDWAAANAPDSDYVASFATDAPFFPTDLVARLWDAVASGTDLACASSSGRSQPVFGLWPVRLREALRRAMIDEEMRKVDVWTARYELAEVRFEVHRWRPLLQCQPAGGFGHRRGHSRRQGLD